MAIGLITYMDTSRREDLVDVITNVTPAETPLLSGLGSGPEATQTLHEYLTDTFAAYTDNAQAEARAFTVADLSQPTRLTNNTQIFADDILVSGTESVVNIGGTQGAFEYQIEKNMKEHAKDIELALMNGSRASGSSGVARRLTGVINGITTNSTTRASGSSLGETTFNDVMELIYASSSMVADEVYVGSTLKRDISGFSATNTRFIAADDKRLVRPVDVYESDFGMHKVFLHRTVGNGANAKELVAIRNEFWKLSWLRGRRTKVVNLPADGDRERAMLISELTLENRGEKTSAWVGGFTS